MARDLECELRRELEPLEEKYGGSLEDRAGYETVALSRRATTPRSVFAALPFLVIDRFRLNQSSLLDFHIALINRVAHRVVASLRTGNPVREVRLVGHADHTGRTPFNFQLAQNRAVAVQRRLAATLERLSPGSVERIRIVAQSLGATWPAFHRSNQTDEGRSRNRRVEVFLVGSPKSRGTPQPLDSGRVREFEFEAEYEGVPSAVRAAFETAARAGQWQNAFLNLNGLNMYEMLRAIEAVGAARFDELWLRREPYSTLVNLPRIHYARNVVLNKVLPDLAVGDLQSTRQVRDAANFIAEKLLSVARAVNANGLASLSLILLECCFYGINDKSHIAYVLASAHHESGMGRQMTELADGTAYEGRTDLCNTQPGDGPRYKGRGFVQITGRCNYTFYRDFLLTRGLNIDLVNTPQRATEPAIAAIILVHGMRYGRFTGARLAQFGTDCNFNFVQARRIVNALDRAENIAAIARRYRAALN